MNPIATIGPPLADPAETGRLGVLQLKRLWSRNLAERAQVMQAVPNPEWVRDRVVIFGLGLSLEETIQFLFQTAPSFAGFEDWILECNGGWIDPRRIDRINAALTGRTLSAIGNILPVLNDEELTHFDEHGFVVVRSAITPEQCSEAVAAICSHLGIDPYNTATWYEIPRGHGIMHQLFHHEALREIREAERIRSAFAELWRTDALWPTVDRVSFNPPEIAKRPFPGPHLHWDVSLELPIPFGLQGLVYLTDTAAEQGAFTCVPGFHRRIEEWLQGLPPGTDPRRVDLSSHAVPVPGSAGDLIVWHQALPHGSRPNTAAQPRFVQYVYYFPIDEQHQDRWR